MFSRQTEKPHSVKWVEAERELAVRRIIIPTRPINQEHHIVQKDTHSVPSIRTRPFRTSIPNASSVTKSGASYTPRK